MSYQEVKDKPAAGAWSSGICDCFNDCRLCVVTTIPYVNALSLGQGYTVMDGHSGIVDEPVCGIVIPAVGACFCPILLCVQMMLMRQKFRSAPHNIESDCCGCPDIVEDATCSLFCGWCVVQQAQRHMQTMDKLSGPAYLFGPSPPNSMADDKNT
mmetsp:Transcript_37045/g.75913  ORF Transcript_37045/g.75913 Transcript_37045/m.75913 type:complete len:155 (+) Transcript_37045:25-489(+)